MSETTYDVVLLVEQPLSLRDAEQVRGLHSDVADPVRYHVLLPVDDAAARVESALGSMASSEVLASPSMVMDRENVEAVQRELLEEARGEVSACVERMTEAGADVVGEVVTADPVSALATKVAEVSAAEAIVLTRSHVIAEFFHVDWTSRARRKLGVPVLHLLEHENFDEQAGGGEGITGL
jgi:aminoglycoside phosphotransferase (APT) family kinase protein